MKLSSLTIYLIGFFLALAIVSFGLFYHWIPNNDEIQKNKAVLVEINAEADKLPQAEKRRQKAAADVRMAAAEWRRIASTRTPPANLAQGGIDVSKQAWQLSVDVRSFRNNVQRLVNKQLHAGNVKVLNGPYVPGVAETEQASNILASYFNYPTYPFPVVIYDLGQVTVQGTYKQITDHVRAWSRFPRFLAVADGLALSGTSPVLTGTYNLQILGYIRAQKVGPTIKEAAASGGGGAGGGFPGFGGPGGPGGPGGFSRRGGPRGAGG